MNASKTLQDIDGLEYDWIGSDSNGFVAFFSTAGGGYAPPEFLGDTDAHDSSIASLLALPASTSARMYPRLEVQYKNTWKEMAERGFFGFDADANGGPYRLVSAPDRPRRLDDLPLDVQRVAERFRSRTIDLSNVEVVTEEMLRAG